MFFYIFASVFAIKTFEHFFCKFGTEKALSSLTWGLMLSISFNSAKFLSTQCARSIKSWKSYRFDIPKEELSSSPILTLSRHSSSVFVPIGCFHNFYGQSNLVFIVTTPKVYLLIRQNLIRLSATICSKN